jgi:hypothetical protein
MSGRGGFGGGPQEPGIAVDRRNPRQGSSNKGQAVASTPPSRSEPGLESGLENSPAMSFKQADAGVRHPSGKV